MENNKQDAIVRKESGELMKLSQPIGPVVEPSADLFETPEVFIVKLDLPGATRDRISIRVESDQLTVRAVAAGGHPEGAKLLYSEIGPKSYWRAFNIGKGIDREAITADLDAGVLTVRMPKTDAIKARIIEIH